MSQLIFVCNFVKKQWILTQFSLLDFMMNDTYELHSPHLINVATLRCETQNSENEAVIDQWRDCLRLCVHASGGHFEHVLWNINVYLYYMVHQNILWNCQCNLVHLMAIL